MWINCARWEILIGQLKIYFVFFSIENKFQAEKRAHHNALERKRRDHIKDSFTALRDAVPSLQGEKVVSILNEQYITSKINITLIFILY